MKIHNKFDILIRDKILQHLNQMIYLRNVTYVRTSLNSSVMNDNVMHARRYIQSCCSLPRITTNKTFDEAQFCTDTEPKTTNKSTTMMKTAICQSHKKMKSTTTILCQ